MTGVCSTRNLDLVRSVGADRVIDYTREDFTRTEQRFDLIIDNVGNHLVSDYVRARNPGGICVGVGFSSMTRLFQNGLLKRFVGRTKGTKLTGILARISNQDLVVLKELMEAGKVVSVIDRCYSLREVPEAFRYAEQGRVRGKVVIAVQ